MDICYGTDASTACPTGQTLIPLQSGQNKCVKRNRIICSEGFFFNSSGCDPCPLGRFQPRTGTGWCDLCPVGTYQDKTGQISCALCEDGTYQNETGSSECRQCPLDGYEDHCLERDQRVSQSYWWLIYYQTTCEEGTIEYLYSRYSYSTYRSSGNGTECIWIPAIRDTYFTHFSSLYSTVKQTRLYTTTTTIVKVISACVNKCESSSETCDAVMYEYKSSTYHYHDCDLLKLVNKTVSDLMSQQT
ncbi:uncharacterized protein LOC125647602 [Ostrea edulis]|uniref:uncharacterized protein LOC125647602 n=1 Tax=Ostrea edulis TaxID=37623 RepID=UPI0024AE9B6E|nr:uncharacterized protein LOC125647602 [Ostrea edulis]